MSVTSSHFSNTRTGRKTVKKNLEDNHVLSIGDILLLATKFRGFSAIARRPLIKGVFDS